MNVSCGVVIDRHVHKNGGTTLRQIFRAHPECTYSGYGMTIESLGSILRRRPDRWWCVEAHYPVASDLAPLVRLSRHIMQPCRVVLALRYRLPVDMYVSYYKWDVIGRQRRGQRGIGRNFTDWIPNNLQTNLLIDAKRSDQAQTKSHAFGVRLSDTDCAVVQSLLHEADIVGPTDSFDEFTRRLFDWTGLSHVASRRIVPEHRGIRGGRVDFACDDDCRDRVMRRSADDQWFVSEATRVYHRQLRLGRRRVPR